MNEHSERIEQGAVLITVNQRLARHHLARYQNWQLARGRQWWETPCILPMRAWLTGLHEQALAAGLSTRTRLPDLLQHRAWRQCIDRDTGLELLDIDAATTIARSAWELSCAWDCRNHENDYLSLDQYTWQRWRERYTRMLEQYSWIDEASLADHLVEVISAMELPECVILEGFLQLPPQLVRFVDALDRAGVSVDLASIAPDAQVHFMTFPDDEQEMLGIANHMRHELERDLGQSLGLVVPDLQKRRTAVMRAFDRVFFPGQSPDEIRALGRPYDLSLGIPLSDTAVVKSALSLLKLCLGSVQGSELSAVLLSPYLEAADAEARRREQLDRRLRDERVRSLTLEQLKERLYPGSRLAPRLGRLLQQRLLGSTSLSDWASRFSDWLRMMGWPTIAIDTEEYQAVNAWLECLDDMQLLDDGQRMNATSALQTVQRLARERIFQLDSPNTPIQIMGRLESHGIAFDCLWVAGLDTEQWPPTGSPSPFLSITRQKEQGVPDASANARLALAEKEFLMWSSQAPLLIASHAHVRDGKLQESAAVPAVQASTAHAVIARERITRMADLPPIIDPVRTLQEALMIESIADEQGPALPAGSEVKGGARLFENQALCPFRAFALHRLLIRPLEEAGMGLDPRQHGTLLHRTLELFWTKMQSHEAMMALAPEAFDTIVAQVVDEAIEELQVPQELRSLERARLGSLLKEWLTRCEAPRRAFEVVGLEQRQTIEHGGIVMNVMLDRIDRIDDALVVVDYKTGTSNTIATWADQRIMNPQLPLYVLTDQHIQGAAFAQVARNQCAFKGIAADDSLLPKVRPTFRKSRNEQATTRPLEDWSDWRAHWQEALDVVASEVRQGLATVTPMKTACLHCELKSLCRIDEASLAQHEEDETAGYPAEAGMESHS